MIPDYTLDFGRKRITMLCTLTGVVTILTKAEVLQLPFILPTGSKVLIENAHGGVPRSKRSRSQYFYAHQLRKWYLDFENNGIMLRLFPEKSMPRANGEFGKAKKTDADDCRALYAFCLKYPNMNYKKPNLNLQDDADPVRIEGWDYRTETTLILNNLRATDTTHQDETNQILVFLHEKFPALWYELDHDIKESLGCDYSEVEFKKSKCFSGRKGVAGPKGTFMLKNLPGLKILCTVVATLLDPEGNMRIREWTQEQPGWDFIRIHIFNMSPHHLKGGTARSNLYFWWMQGGMHQTSGYVPNYIAKKTGQNVEWIKKKRRGGKFAKGKTKLTLPDGSIVEYNDGDYMLETKMTDIEEKYLTEATNHCCHMVRKLFQLFKPMVKEWTEQRRDSRELLGNDPNSPSFPVENTRRNSEAVLV